MEFIQRFSPVSYYFSAPCSRTPSEYIRFWIDRPYSLPI